MAVLVPYGDTSAKGSQPIHLPEHRDWSGNQFADGAMKPKIVRGHVTVRDG